MWPKLFLALVTLVPTLAAAQGDGKTYTGKATYNPFRGGRGSCGYAISDTEAAVALDKNQFESYMPAGGNSNLNPVCGQAISISFGGRTHQAKIHDLCGDCGGVGGLDLTPTLFDTINPEGRDAGSYQVEWWFNDGEPQQVTTPSTAAATSAAAQTQPASQQGDTTGIQPAAEGVAEIAAGNCVKGQSRCNGLMTEKCDATSQDANGVTYAFVPTGACPTACDASSGVAMCI